MSHKPRIHPRRAFAALLCALACVAIALIVQGKTRPEATSASLTAAALVALPAAELVSAGTPKPVQHVALTTP